jgi:hypothetical protein
LRKVLNKWPRKLSSIKEDTGDLNPLIALMDVIENLHLSDMERGFLLALKNHLAVLLNQKLAYWKQRRKIKWVTLETKLEKIPYHGN